MRALTTRDRFGLAFIAELRGGGCKTKTRDVTEPISTVCANGQHHMLVRNNGTSPEAGLMCPPMDEPARTFTTAGHQSVEDCTFRMLEPGDIQRAMAFTPGYAVHGVAAASGSGSSATASPRPPPSSSSPASSRP